MLLAAFVLLLPRLTFAASAASDAIAAAVRDAVADAQNTTRPLPDPVLLDRLYAARGYAPLWSAGGKLDARARDAIGVLQEVAVHGLDPADYDGSALAAEAARLTATRDGSPVALGRFDARLTGALLRLLADLHLGRVDPSAMQVDYDRLAKRVELAAFVDELAAGTPVGAVVAAAAPPFVENLLLERQLARYRALAADPSVTPVAIATGLRPRARFAGAAALARWLAALGDLPGDAAVPAKLYDGPLVEAVQRFQLRHGLTPDGIIGTTTAAALAVPAATRARQIELALERLRWLPALARDRTVIVNVPGFEAIAFDEIGAGRPPAFRMPVVVGRALSTETPFFSRPMTRVVFAPYWNVPPSILRNELLAKVRARPSFLASEDMEIVNAGQVLAPNADAVARLGRGAAELRQRPGPKNPLGHVKFLFPNPYDVYMHDTPALGLFGKARRDFSHGCIRLGDAAAMAHWVLDGEGLSPERVDELLAAEHSTTVELRRPIAVVIAYTTAAANFDGSIDFYADVYGHDAELERALAVLAYRR